MQKHDPKNSQDISDRVMRVEFRNAVTAKAGDLWNTDKALAGKLNIAAEGVFYSREKFDEQGIAQTVKSIVSIKEPEAVIEQMVSIFRTMTSPARACTP